MLYAYTAYIAQSRVFRGHVLNPWAHFEVLCIECLAPTSKESIFLRGKKGIVVSFLKV